MSAYLKFFELEQSPFEGKAQAKVILGTKALREAFATIQQGLNDGAARICVSGGQGLGKTSLARALPKLLGGAARVAVVLDPTSSWDSLRVSIAKQWGLSATGLARANLLATARDQRLVLVIDQAETSSEEFLDHLDILLSYRSEEDQAVVQSVLLARLGGGGQTDPPALIWWLDRIQTLQLEFSPLPRDGIESYIHKHLKRAGWRGERLFSPEAAMAIHGYTGGIPGEISGLCERLLAVAAAQGHRDLDADFVHANCGEDAENEADSSDSAPTDEFERLVLEDEFRDADPVPAPSIVETLEHFEQHQRFEPGDDDDDDGEVYDDEDSIGAAIFDDPFSGPPTPDELRAIRGSLFARNMRPIAAAAMAALIGGIAIALFSTNDEPGSNPAPAGAEDSTQVMPNRSAASDQEAPPVVLGRLRGPATSMPSHLPKRPGPSLPVAIVPSPAPLEFARAPFDTPPTDTARDSELDWDGDDEDDDARPVSEDDLVDMRPASMFPGASRDSRSEKSR